MKNPFGYDSHRNSDPAYGGGMPYWSDMRICKKVFRLYPVTPPYCFVKWLYSMWLWTKLLVKMRIGFKEWQRMLWLETWLHYEMFIDRRWNFFWAFHSRRSANPNTRNETRLFRFKLCCSSLWNHCASLFREGFESSIPRPKIRVPVTIKKYAAWWSGEPQTSWKV